MHLLNQKSLERVKTEELNLLVSINFNSFALILWISTWSLHSNVYEMSVLLVTAPE